MAFFILIPSRRGTGKFSPSPAPPPSISTDEAALSTEEAQTCAHAWLSRTHAHAGRAGRDQAPAPQGSRAAGRLSGVGQKRRRLSRSAEFDRVYRHGTSASSRHLVLYAFPRGPLGESEAHPSERDDVGGNGADDGSRLGVSVGRRVGGAVVRNRVKRQLREAFWSVAGELPGDHDFVIVARSDAGGLAERDGAGGFERELRDLARKLGWSGQGDGDGAAG